MPLARGRLATSTHKSGKEKLETGFHIGRLGGLTAAGLGAFGDGGGVQSRRSGTVTARASGPAEDATPHKYCAVGASASPAGTQMGTLPNMDFKVRTNNSLMAGHGSSVYVVASV